VPPEQSERFAAAIARREVPYAYLLFDGESHGFRKASSIVKALESELAFYGQILGFDPKTVPPVELTVGRPPVKTH
jgi:dipeptidyl aminopeptidase/acylaminoacyl peptidase